MTIASHCIDLLRANGPMTAEELGDACRVARVTAAQSPAGSVSSALGWNSDGRAVKIGERYQLVSQLLDRRWLTTAVPVDPVSFTPGVDLRVLEGIAHREGIPLRSGGRLRGDRYGSMWHGPAGWAAHGDDLVGLRLVDGVAEVAAVALDDAARERGAALAERVLAGRPPYYWSYDAHGKKVRALLALCAEDEDLLRDPVPPLGELLPDPAPWRPGPDDEPLLPEPVTLDLPPWLREVLGDAAAGTPMALGPWIVAQLERMSAWPYLPRVDFPDVDGYRGLGAPDGDYSGLGYRGLSVVATDGWRRGPVR